MKRTLFLSMLAVSLLIHAEAQQGTDLERTSEKIARYVAMRMPGWEEKRGNLIEGSSDVVIQLWTFPNRIVKVSLMQRESVADARARLSRFAQDEPEARELHGFGDEAYSWGAEDANIVFRRGKYTVYVATIADVDHDVDAGTLSPAQKHERRKSEMKRLSKELAKQTSDAIDQP